MFHKFKAVPLKVIGILAGAFVFFAPWLGYVVSLGTASNTQPLIPPPTSFNIFQTFVIFLFGFQQDAIQKVLISLWPLALTIIFIIFTRRKKAPAHFLDYFAMATFLPVALVFAISYIKPIFLSRYLILVTPTMFLLLSWLIMNYSKKISLVLVGLFLAVMLGLSVHQNISAATPVKENYQGVSQYLSEHATYKDIVVVTAPFTVYPVEYSYTGQARIDTIPHWNRYVSGSIPQFTLTGLQDQMNEFQKQYADMYVVYSYDQGYESDIKHYLDSHYQIEKDLMFSSGIELRVYKLRYDIPE